MMNIRWEEEDFVEKKLSEIIKSGFPIVFWGFGGTAIHQYEYLKSKIPVACFVDSNPQKVGLLYDQTEIISFEQLKSRFQNTDCNILITVNSKQYVEEIRTQISRDGQFKRVYHLDLYYPLGKDIRELLLQSLNDIKAVYRLLGDELSQKCFENKLNYMLTKNEKYLSCYKSDRVYFPKDIFHFGAEVFVDGGAYHGEDTLALMEQTCIKQAYLFEPDEMNYQYILSHMRDRKNCEIYHAALWSTNTKLLFSEQGTMGSAVHKNGNRIVTAKKIDDCNNAGQPITFIKLDVEGAELEALDGARHTILQNQPKLAVCVYHRVEHHWLVPLKILKICPNYQLFMRQDDQTGMETICYGKVNI